MERVINGPRKRLSKADGVAITNSARRQLLSELQEMEQRAHDLGMTITGHALNNAKNAAGWEMAGNSNAAGLAARGERVGG